MNLQRRKLKQEIHLKESTVSKEENKYPCDDCGKLFTRRNDVKDVECPRHRSKWITAQKTWM